MAKKITWWEAAEIIGVTDRTMRRWLELEGYSGLVDRRFRSRRQRYLGNNQEEQDLSMGTHRLATIGSWCQPTETLQDFAADFQN